jgi:hypothetical protein
MERRLLEKTVKKWRRKGLQMRIAGRLALQSASPSVGLGYHGCDVFVCKMNGQGFEAELTTAIPKGSLVRLRLPGAGTMLARVAKSHGGVLKADFVNPVSMARLNMTVGLMAALA